MKSDKIRWDLAALITIFTRHELLPLGASIASIKRPRGPMSLSLSFPPAIWKKVDSLARCCLSSLSHPLPQLQRSLVRLSSARTSQPAQMSSRCRPRVPGLMDPTQGPLAVAWVRFSPQFRRPLTCSPPCLSALGNREDYPISGGQISLLNRRDGTDVRLRVSFKESASF